MAPAEYGSNSTSISPFHPFVTADNHTSLLDVVGWFSVVVMVLIVLVRLGTRWAKSRTVGFDDGAIILSTIFAIAQTSTVSLGVSNGLGRSIYDATATEITAQQKLFLAIYIFTILFILGQFFAKLSIISFIVALSPYKIDRILSWSFATITCIWMTISVFGFSFQCKTFYTFVESFNIILDTALAVFPSFIIVRLQLDTRRKAITIGFFMSRLFVAAASIAQLVVIYTRTEDPFLSWTFPLLVMIIQAFGIITACGPYLRPFLESVNSGMIGNDDIRRRQGGTFNGYYKSEGSGGCKQTRISRKLVGMFTGGSKELPKPSHKEEDRELGVVKLHQEPGQGQTVHQTQVYTSANEESEEWEAGSHSSRAGFIRQTTTFSITLKHSHAT